MFLRLLQLQWKSYRRSAAFTSGVITSVFYLFGMLYFFGMFTLLGYGSFYVLDEEMGVDPLHFVNQFMIYGTSFWVAWRYFIQKMPVLNIRALLTFPIKENTIVHYALGRTIFSFFNVSKQEVDELLAGYADFFNDEILNKNKYIRDLSKGNQKKVGVVATFIGAPELLILDEPFANLDPPTQIRLKELLTEKGKDPNTTILISSHDIQHVTEVCERITVLEKGEIVKDLQTTAKTLKEFEAFFTK